MRIWLVLKNSDKNSKCIVPFDYYVTNMNINTPQKPENANNSTCTEIRNAWVGFTYVDNRGIIWIDVDRLNSILRTSKPRAKYELLQIDDSAKLRQGNKTYIRAYNLIGILEKFIQESKIGKRREYLKYSEQIYRAIRDSNDVLVIGEKYNNEYKRLDYVLEEDGTVSLVNIASQGGMKIYRRTLIYIMAKAFDKLYKEAKIRVNYQLAYSMFCSIDNMDVTTEILTNVENEMRKIVSENLPIIQKTLTREEAEELYIKEDYLN